MTHAPNRFAPVLRLGLAGLAGLLIASSAAADLGEPAIATPGDIEDHRAESEDLGDRISESEDLRDHEAHSRSPSSLEARSERIRDHETTSEDIERHEATSHALDDLEPSGIDHGFDPIELPGQAEWAPTTDPQLVVARHRLERAQEKARAARARYGEMMRNDYPRGDARMRIIEARDAAERELARAKAAVLAIDDGAPAAVGR